MIWKIIFVAVLAVGVLGNYEIPEEIRQQGKSYLTNLCTKNGAQDKVQQVEDSIQNFSTCVQGIINPDTLKQEIEEAKPHGALDEVFKKYCVKTPELKACVHSLTTGVTPCIDPSYHNQVSLANNITDQLLDFVCYKEGDRIALFIAEHGPECFADKATPIQECAKKIQQTVSTVEAAKKLSTDQQCGKYDELSACIVTALEGCENPTPANIAEALFRFIRKSTPCPKKND